LLSNDELISKNEIYTKILSVQMIQHMSEQHVKKTEKYFLKQNFLRKYDKVIIKEKEKVKDRKIYTI